MPLNPFKIWSRHSLPPTSVPFKEDGFAGHVIRPEAALPAFSASRVLIANGGLGDLEIGFGADFFAQGLADHRKHLREAEHPVGQGLGG